MSSNCSSVSSLPKGCECSSDPCANLLRILACDGSFNTFLQLLELAGLLCDVANRNAQTVFAPTDDAFAQLPPATLAKLLLPANRAILKDVLLYHFLGRCETTIAMSRAPPTVEQTLLVGKTLTVKLQLTATATTVVVVVDQLNNTATIIEADVQSGNGIAQYINRVLFPFIV